MDAEIRAFRVEPQTFQEDVVERSKQIPVVLLFWTDQVPPAVETKRLLESLVEQYQGKFVLGHSDVAVEPAVAQQLRVQSHTQYSLVTRRSDLRSAGWTTG